MKLEVPENYPLVPPKATFLTKVFHPNVHFKARPPHPIMPSRRAAPAPRRAIGAQARPAPALWPRPCAAPPLPCAHHRQAVYSLSGFLKTWKPLLLHKLAPCSAC